MPTSDDDPRVTTTLTLRRSVREALEKITTHENNSMSRIVERLIMDEASKHPSCADTFYSWKKGRT